MRYRIIGDELTVLGFSLAGVVGEVATDSESAGAAFDAALEEDETGILLITERIADLIRPRVDELLFSDRFPLVLEIPDYLGPLNRQPLREMVNQAIGISV